MSIPDYAALMLPLLRRAAKAQNGVPVLEITQALAAEIGLSPIEAAQRLPSGETSLFDMRVQWAPSYLESSGLLEAGDGNIRITLPGLDFLKRSDEPGEPEGQVSHMERIAEHHGLHRQEMAAELLRRVHGMSPEFFEQLIIDVLLAMGYGSTRAGIAQRLGRPGDGGIDGEIMRDELGLDRIYVQAKRYAPGSFVPVSEVRDFAGALDSRRADAGVFVTTAEFPVSARDFVEKVRTRIALVDGAELARLMLRHGIGVRLVRSYAVHHLDGDYFRE
jgi:restriction system protein